MNEEMIFKLCSEYFLKRPEGVFRCGVGQGNYIYIVKYVNKKYIVQCSTECNAYKNTICWLEK